ncbi:MAG: translation initiation factor IF-3 [Deltaproteobacteria bacterium]|nr:translation initiation factor IF-3 [Deltaproteobacteria bacterium]
MVKEVAINWDIRAPGVRVIDSDGKQIGIMPLKEAMRISEERGLDLVEVAPNSNPPVCRIMNYGKYKYQQSKRIQEARKHQTIIQVKEVKVRPRTEEHDFQFKLRHVKRFLSEGNKVKISILFRGREIAHPEFGREMLNRFLEEVKDLMVLEQAPRLEGRNMVMIIAPKS